MLFHGPYLKLKIDHVEVEESALKGLPQGEHLIEIYFATLPKELKLSVDDCLEELSVNDIAISDQLIPYCNYSKELSVSLDQIEDKAINKLTAKVVNTGGRGEFLILQDRVVNYRIGQVLLLVTGLMLVILSISKPDFLKQTFLPLVLLVLARGVVAAVIPVELRSSDFEGHLAYFQYMFSSWKLPGFNQCWECYQPPLFYYLVASLSRLVGEELLYIFPILISVCSSLVYLLILYRIFHTRYLIWSSSLVFLLPGLLIAEVAFNNDSLAILFSALAIYFGVIWLESRDFTNLIITSILIGLGLLTKLTLLPIAAWWLTLLGVCCLRKRSHFKQAFVSGGIIFLISAPYIWIRWLETDTFELTGNITSLNGALAVTNSIQTFLSFDLLSLLERPYIHPWQNDFHRESFFEYLFLSGIFTENWQFKNIQFSQISVALLLLSLLLSLWFLLAFPKRIFPRQLSFIALTGVLVLSLAINRIVHPFSACNNFRLIAALAIPVAVLFGSILPSMPKILRQLAYGATALGVTLSWLAIFFGDRSYSG